MAHVPIPLSSMPAPPPPRLAGRRSPMVCPLAKLGRTSPTMEHPRYRHSPSIDVSYRRSPLEPAVYSRARGTPSPLEPSVYIHHFPPRVPPPAPLGGFRNLSSSSVSETSLTAFHSEMTNYCIPEQLPSRENVPALYQQRLLSQVDPLRCSPALRRASSPTTDHSFPYQTQVLESPFKGRTSPSLDQGYHTLVSPSPGPSTPGPWTDYSPFSPSTTKSKKGSSGRTPSLTERLPDEVMVRVFSWLSSSELCVCARVCKRWNNLAWDPSLWRTIQLSGEGVSGDKGIRSVLRRLGGQGSGVLKVLLSDGAKLSDKGLTQLARRCPELTHLQLQGCVGITNHALFEVAAKCGNLQHLDVTGCTGISCLTATPAPEPLGPPRLLLQYLDLTDCSAVDDAGLKLIVRSCPQLVYLYLRRCIHVTDAGIKFVPSFCCALRELSVSDCNRVTDFGLHELAKLGATLRYLSVAKCEQVSDAGLKVIARRCYKLRYLNARGCEAVSDDALTVLARSCPRLRALDIGKCDVSDAGLRALAESCPNLKKLSLRNCDLVTDRGVQCIAYYCRGLQQLNIQDCHISLEGYRAVRKYCKRCVIEHTNPGFF